MQNERRPVQTAAEDRLIYVMPQEAIEAFVNKDLSLADLWKILWRGKWLIIAVTTIFGVLSIARVLTATEWYRADVLMAPAKEGSQQGLAGTLGGLATLAGVNVGGGDRVESIAVLRSREFAQEFIEDQNLMPLFFPGEWDGASTGPTERDESAQPDIRDGVKFFDDYVRTVTEDRNTGLVTLSIEWTDPDLAARWANMLVRRLNEYMRQKALVEAEANVAYLQSELGKTNVVTLQQSIGRLMESELQKLMLARGNEEFAFRVVDSAQVPKIRSRPRRTLTVVLFTFAGGIFSVLLVLVLNAVRSSGKLNSSDSAQS